MSQYGLPVSDVSHVNWTQGAGDGNANHFEELDEGFGAGRGSGSGPDDATTYWDNSTMGTTFTDPLDSKLSAVTDPVSSANHTLFTRSRKSAAAGKQVDVQNELRQGGILISGSVITINIDEVWTNRGSGTLSAAQADSITNYADLEARTYFRNVGGGAARTGHESAHEFECPDAAVVDASKPWRRTAHVPGQRYVTPGTIFGRSW